MSLPENDTTVTPLLNSANDSFDILLAGDDTIYQDHKGILWLGTTNGFCELIVEDQGRVYFKRHMFISDTQNELLPNIVYGIIVYGIHADRSGRLWLATEQGLLCYNIEEEEFKTLRARMVCRATEYIIF
ncbi:hypothetical protein EH222_05420 [candidate division KSB1 bacterium]|nr:MAG: hypothetical protein EH222_05420 [candidate division KSB1 bacterium]